jgi:lysophospholipase L1-like esterase
MRVVTALLAVLLAMFAGTTALRAAEPMLAGVQRMLVLGDSITYSGQYVEMMEAYLATRFPSRTIEVLNLGLPSETVSGLSEDGHADGQFARPDLHERLGRVMEATKADLVIACYGMNDGIYLPFEATRFAAFTNGIIRLRQRVLPPARLIHVTPPIFDESRGKGPGYANTLDRYSEWMVSQRRAGWDVVDLHGAMKRHVAEARKRDPQFHLASDGVHPAEAGHWLMAKAILQHLGAKDLDHVEGANAMLRGHPNGVAIYNVVQQRHRILRDAWLTSTGHTRPGISKGLPLGEAQAKARDMQRQIHALTATLPPRHLQ